jgi:carbon monoxide dehydrogenase subunit G
MPDLRYRSYFLMAAFFVASQLNAQTGTDYGRDLSVVVKRSAGAVLIDVSMSVKASPQQAWDVLTDYDHMANFFPNLRTSRVVERTGNRIRIEQTGSVSYGPLSFPFESMREIELSPYREIRSRAIGGSLRKGDATTRLIPEGASTRIVYHSESVPAVWVPPGIGPRVIANQTGAQFESLRSEILKRRSAARNPQ